jgi:uncharacterized phage protein (TIGR01671 family)
MLLFTNMSPREIKFRFWNKIANRFQPSSKYAIDGDGKLVAYDYEMHEYNEPVDFSNTIIVAQQYTGLKDKNDKEIYEGDILYRSFDEGHSYKYLVGFNEVDAAFSLLEKNEEFSMLYVPVETFAIIGNIFENTELLEK